MKLDGDKATRGPGDKEAARPRAVASSPCTLVSSSPRHSRTRAFTLPEVLATLVLVGLVLPAVMKGISLSLAASDDARRRVEAVGLAENKLAEMTADAAANQVGGGSGDFGDEAPGYRWETSATSVDTNLAELRVRVAWTARGAERWVDLSSYAYISAGATGTSSSTGLSGSGGAQ